MGALSMQAELPSTLPGAMWLPGVCLAFGGRGAGAQAFPSVVLRGRPRPGLGDTHGGARSCCSVPMKSR